MKKMRIWVAVFVATILMPCMAQEPQEVRQISETIEIVEDDAYVSDTDKDHSDDSNIEIDDSIFNTIIKSMSIGKKEEDEVFQVKETMPEFPGGMHEYMNWLRKNMKYPTKAAEKGKQGRVIVQFVIDRDGSITDPKVIRSVDPYLDKEALRVVKAMPKWKPGTQRGKPVRVKYTLPMQFRLDGGTKKKIQRTETPQNSTAAYSSRGGEGSIKSAFEALSTSAKKVEVMPEYIGGEEAMLQFLTSQTDYAEIETAAQSFGQQYIIKFIVGADGKLRDHAILRGIPTEMAEKALNIVKAMPDWKPGTVDGTPKDMLYAVALPFKVAKKEAVPHSSKTESEGIKKEVNGEIFQVVGTMPEFPGGVQELMKWIQQNLKYPKTAAENGVQGRVVVEFVIEADGSVTDPVVTRSLDPSCDKEALRLINSMPKWKPGTKRGEPVRVKYTLPVQFRL